MAEFRGRNVRLSAGLHNSFDPSSPGLDHSCPEKDVGDLGVEGMGGVFPEQAIRVPFRGELSVVPDREPVVVDANLNGDMASVVLVEDGVGHGLAKSITRHWEGFDPLETLVGDESLKILGAEKVHRFVDLGEEIPVNLVLVKKIGAPAKIPDLDIGSRHECLGIGMEKEERPPSGIGPISELSRILPCPVPPAQYVFPF